MKNILTVVAACIATSLFAAGPGGGGGPGGDGNQPGGGGSSATFTFDTFLAASTTNTSKCVIREGKWTGWTSGITAAALSSSVSNLAAGVCAGCATLTSVDLSSCTTLTEIPDSAFAGCTALTAVTLPSSCATVGANAFAGCTALSSFTGAGVTAVGADAFHGCTALTTAAVATSATLPTPVGAYAYAQSGVTSADVSGVSSLGAGAFAGCESLASATVATSATLPDALFAGCTALATINAEDVADFGMASLAGCDALTTLTLSSSATLGDYALAADTATVATTLEQSALPSYADTSFLGREVSYMPDATSVTRIEASDLVDWLLTESGNSSSSVTQPADYSTATLKTWLSGSGNAYGYVYADDLAADEDFVGLTVSGASFIYNAPTDAALAVSVEPVACYTLSSEESDWAADNLTWSDDGGAYLATDTTQTSCFARLRFTWDW